MRLKLHTQILLGLLLGVLAGLLIGPRIVAIRPLGDAFIRLITMIVVPLVFASILVGVASLGDIAKLGRIGIKTIVYYLTTTAIAITIGLTLANLVRPGSRLDPAIRDRLLTDFAADAQVNIERAATPPSIVDTLLGIIPTNPAAAFAEADMLQVIFFALAFGIALTYLDRSRSEPVLRFMEAVNDAMIQLVHLVMKLAPFGVFALIGAIIGQYGLGILRTLLTYSVVVLLGLAIHALVVYPTAVRLFAGMRARHFFRGIAPAQLMAFSTSSSNATLPVTMECVEETSTDVTEYIGGICTDDGVKWGIGIPGLDSFLVDFSTDTEVIGYDTVPEEDQPHAKTLLHLSFDTMVGIGTALIGLGLWFGFVWWRRRDIPQTPWFLRAVAGSGVATIVAMEAGWIVTEVGRQPWIVYEVMRVEDAVTGANGIWFTFIGSLVLYTILGVATVLILRTMARRWRDAEVSDAEIPYGPREEKPAKGGSS